MIFVAFYSLILCANNNKDSIMLFIKLGRNLYRSYLKGFRSTILLLTALLCSCSQPSENALSPSKTTKAEQTYQWKLVTSWPKNFPGLGVGPERFAELVKTMSGGRLIIKVYGAGEIVPALEVFDAVSRGTAEMGHSGAYYWKGKAPAAQFFSSVPFGLTAQEMNGWLHHGGGLELWKKVYEPYGITPMAGGNSGVQMAGWFNKEINSMNDLKGLKMRIPGLGGDVLSRAGGSPVTLPGAEIYTALQTNLIDATEWVGPYNDLAFGLFQVGKYYYYPGWHEPGTVLEFILNTQALNALPEDLQAIVTSAARVVNQDMLDEYMVNNQKALQTLILEHNVKVKPLPTEVLKGLQYLAKDVLEEVAKSDKLSQEVYQSFNEYLTKVRAYNDISERAYLNAR
jgi:TRAP-type mannitol/chloroaromatic compound transport system substrate-binding protein